MENQFTKLQGQYLAFIVAYSKLNRRPPAEADLQRHLDVSPPSIHNMVVPLERRGLIKRTPGRPRSIEVLCRLARFLHSIDTHAMNTASEGHRRELLNGLRRFVASVRQIAGVRRIAVLGSIVTAKPDPQDVDVLVVVADDADLAPLATCSRRLQGHAQSVNRGADVFLADERGTYIGRICRWKDCRAGVRRSCDALHCGRRPHLHDDLDAIRLNSTLVLSPPVTLWPHVERRGQLPPDVEELVAALEHAV